jgi:signal transduction histidine kinase
VVDEIFTDDKAQPKARVVSELAFAGSAANGKYDPVGPQPAAFAVVVFHCEDGTVLGTVGAARNISERKAAEAAREMALAEAMRLARQRSEFLAQMSHELRTPLNAILGYAQILRHDSNLCERQMRGLATILESGQHLLTLINDILDLARIDADKLKLNPNTINLASFVHVVADIIGVKVDEKSLSFSWQLEPGLSAAVKVDDRRLRQVLLNLLGNAVKFTDRGAIALRVQCAGCRGKATA